MINCLTTRSGRIVNFEQGTPSIEDIAIALSRTPQFNGQSTLMVSMASQSLLTAWLMPKNQIYGLLNHVCVASIGHCPASLQGPEYRRYASQLKTALCQEFHIQPPGRTLRAEVALFDDIAAGALAHANSHPQANLIYPMSKEIMRATELALQMGKEMPNTEVHDAFLVNFADYLAAYLDAQEDSQEENST